jgi:ribosomal protein S18 acetylase RimI-like enzyme
MNTRYRRGVPADAARLAEFAARTFTETYEKHNTPEDMRAYLAGAFGVAQQARELSDPAMVAVLAESGDAIVGYALLRRGGSPPGSQLDAPIEIYRFYVDSAAHGTGVAQRLMAESLMAAQDLGGRQVWLGVWERNPRAIAFYMKCGFRDVGTQLFQLGADLQTDRVLVQNL